MLLNILQKKQSFFALASAIFISTQALVAMGSGADWTPYFKSWEKSCDLSGQQALLDNLIPDYEIVYNLDNSYSGIVPFKPGKIVLSSKYSLYVDSELDTTFGSF
ncbi:hypothetical protein [Psychrobacter urativorans]|uniref:hypothetical protein n=1 Tax=Psychrobacter urativorans TaxID=45610 RepID=UPI0019187B63|nr:hypothetical protein [Psychrobacter urativorans]